MTQAYSQHVTFALEQHATLVGNLKPSLPLPKIGIFAELNVLCDGQVRSECEDYPLHRGLEALAGQVRQQGSTRPRQDSNDGIHFL